MGSEVIPVGAIPSAEALRARRSELSNQITSAQGRRSELIRELQKGPEPIARAGLEQRLTVLDARIVQLEKDIAENGRQLALAVTTTSSEDGTVNSGLNSGQITGITIVFIVFVLAPVAIAFARAMLRRANRPPPAPNALENTARLERMEQAIDTIAVEVERISEGQRFVTQLMAPRTAEPVLIDERHDELRKMGHEVPDKTPA